MLRFFCGERRPDGGLTRREWLRIGGLAGLGTLAPAMAAASESTSRTAGFGRARSVLLLFTGGGMSQLDTFDPKPDAPAEIRGEFRTMPTAVAGTRVCEHLPHLARLTDRFAVVRSVSH